MTRAQPLHTAYFLPIGSPFVGVRRAVLAEYRQALKRAKQISAAVMNTHYQWLPPFCTSEQAVQWYAQTSAPLCEKADDVGVTVVLEHVPHGGEEQLERFVEIMERIPLLRFHLDSGHAKLERRYDRFDEYLDRLGNKLLHVHLSDDDGADDHHLPLGASSRSTTNWPQHISKLKAAGYNGTITMEVFSPHRKHLILSRDLLQKWWDAG